MRDTTSLSRNFANITPMTYLRSSRLIQPTSTKPTPIGSMTSSAERPPIVRFSHSHQPARPPQWTLRLGPNLDRGLVGGKAFGLSRLLDAGFLVPPAFCITTEAFENSLKDLTS